MHLVPFWEAVARALFQTHWQFVDLLAPPLDGVKAAQLCG